MHCLSSRVIIVPMIGGRITQYQANEITAHHHVIIIWNRICKTYVCDTNEIHLSIYASVVLYGPRTHLSKRVKGAVAEILVKMLYFFVFFFIGENLSLRSN